MSSRTLLTREQLKPMFHEAWGLFKEAVARGDEIEEDRAAFCNEYVCRAQVERIDKALFAPWEQRLTKQLTGEGYIEHRVRLDVALRTVQAARNALKREEVKQ